MPGRLRIECDDAIHHIMTRRNARQNIVLLAAGFDKTNVRIAWLGNKPLQLVFG